ncbi:hypothetical protein [Kitasatospora sp. NPDC088134]|uniref:hypothetical protein n=1 Tax=Kitasatospora sp. NPDC088134 TaxID=3364071 RepID=UPI00381EB914
MVEVDPRCAGGLPISPAAGADPVGQDLRALPGLPVEPDRLRYVPGVTTVRSFVEHRGTVRP